jgi:hypothetical protein
VGVGIEDPIHQRSLRGARAERGVG